MQSPPRKRHARSVLEGARVRQYFLEPDIRGPASKCLHESVRSDGLTSCTVSYTHLRAHETSAHL
eukprot:651988-Alexandrium_andersonii.AAC.1